jgi:hypothetical protein
MNYLRKAVEEYDLNAAIENYIATEGQPDAETRFSMAGYSVSKALDMVMENWNSNSFFLDLENHTATLKYLLQDIADGNAEDWYLVPVDFHF